MSAEQSRMTGEPAKEVVASADEAQPAAKTQPDDNRTSDDKDAAKSKDRPKNKDPPANATKPNEKTTSDDASTNEKTVEEERPADPWTKFAPVPERTPGRLRRTLRVVGRTCTHEWTIASLAAVLLAVAMTWPTLRYPLYTIPQDVWDPTLQAWQMSWSGHILSTDVSQLWHANAFYPERYSFAFTDTLLGYAPAGLIGNGPRDALLRYNIMYVFSYALAFLGAYALVRQLGAGRTGAAVAGVAFAYAPWRLAQAGHLHILSTGGIALALAMLARGHGWSLRHGYRPERRRTGWVVAGWLTAAWQLTLGFGIGLPFAYALGTVAVVAFVTWWVRRIWVWKAPRPFGIRLILADVLGGLAFAATGVLMSLPYFKVVELHPYAKRSIDELKLFSVPLKGFFIAPQESRLWGESHAEAREGLTWAPEMTMLPGFVLYALAISGLFFSIWRLRQRLLLLAGVLGTTALAMGTQFFGGHVGYLLLYKYLPGWEGLRTPGRLVLWTTLLLGILAAGSVSAFVERARETRREPAVAHRFGFWLRLATLIPLALVIVEGLNLTPHPTVPEQPQAMRTAQSPMLVLPSDGLIDNNVMLWSTDRFEPIVNGNSGFTPARLNHAREVTQSFPDPTSISYLREMGVRTVILLPDRAAGTPWENAATVSVDLLGITREEVGGAIVYRLTP